MSQRPARLPNLPVIDSIATDCTSTFVLTFDCSTRLTISSAPPASNAYLNLPVEFSITSFMSCLHRGGIERHHRDDALPGRRRELRGALPLLGGDVVTATSCSRSTASDAQISTIAATTAIGFAGGRRSHRGRVQERILSRTVGSVRRLLSGLPTQLLGPGACRLGPRLRLSGGSLDFFYRGGAASSTADRRFRGDMATSLPLSSVPRAATLSLEPVRESSPK